MLRHRRLGALLAVLTIGVVPGVKSPGAAAIEQSCNVVDTPPVAETGRSGGFHPINPVRLLDTRDSGPLRGGCFTQIDLRHTPLAVHATAIGVNLTGVESSARGFVTAWPCDAPRPFASNLNLRVNDPTPNLAIVTVGPSRQLCLYSNVTTHLVVDFVGWFSAGGDALHPLAPARALDTRLTERPDGGSGFVAADSTLGLPVAGRLGVPSGATAVSVNITATETGAAGFVTVYPCGLRQQTSTVNYLAGDTRANQALVGLDPTGKLCIYTRARAHIIVDISGWFGPRDAGTNGGEPFQPLVAQRLVDSRDGTGGWSTPTTFASVRSFDPTGGGRFGIGAAVVVNLVATDAAGNGFLTLYPCGQPRPATSTLNVVARREATNLAVVPVGADGRICLYSAAQTDVVIDLVGSFGPGGGLTNLTVVGHTLLPDFGPDQHDYGVRCTTGANVWSITMTPRPSATASIVGQPNPQAVVVTENQAAVVRTVGPGAGTDEYWIRCLPHDFPELNVARPADAGPGWYLLATGFGAPVGTTYALILDSHGAPVWYHKTPNVVIDVQRMPNGNLAWTELLGNAFGTDPTRGYEIHRLDGSLVRTVKAVGTSTDHHEMVALPNGNMLVATYPIANRDLRALGYSASEPSASSDIQEIDPAGNVVWQWHGLDHFNLSEITFPQTFPTPGGPVVDLLHLNSIRQADSGDLIVSFRHLDAVVRIDRTTGNVEWKVGGTPTTHDPGAIVLTITGDPMGGIFRQHDANLDPDGNLWVYDNETGRTGASSRAAEFVLDLPNHMARFVFQQGRADGQFTFGLGSTRRQADGSVVIGWGGLQPLLTHIDAVGNLLLEVTQSPGGMNYRTVREPPNAFDRATLRAAVSQAN